LPGPPRAKVDGPRANDGKALNEIYGKRRSLIVREERLEDRNKRNSQERSDLLL
jgi:hypothetical protein